MNERLFALIPSAGVGSRAGQSFPKQYRMIAGRDILHHTLLAFDACHEIAKTLVVLAPDDRHFDSRRFSGLRFVVRRCGGALRQDTVLNGLEVLAELGASDQDWVLVHDAARPGITPALIRSLIESVRDDDVGGILAIPVTDALKRAQPQEEKDVQDEPRVLCRESKKALWLAQTPQMFRMGILRDALVKAQQAQQPVEDEAEAMERMGYHPRMVLGSLRNVKVTYPDDFKALEGLLASSVGGLQVSEL